ncbi:VOC family protein [Shimia biformata]|uniref:VOC family protein n=1 Tax=Shimia biformata TaxID=1294299 RepID=UPI00194DB3D9|nr:VOC family protein [Shimia biformata]
MSKTHGMVWWSELMTRDIKGALDYYTKTCGWEIDQMPMGDDGTYYIGKAHGTMITGMMDMTGMEKMPGMEHLAQVPAHWMTYFAVDDVDAAAKATAEAGGEVIRAPFDIPGTGRIAILKDPGGAVLGLMTPDAAALEAAAKG